MTVKTYDPKCRELAEHFLCDEPCRDDPQMYQQHCHALALTIQQVVEDWAYEPLEPQAAKNPTRRGRLAGCSFCDEHPGLMPPHDASSRCESGKHSHCTCDVCF
jgi:hypothetical protein